MSAFSMTTSPNLSFGAAVTSLSNDNNPSRIVSSRLRFPEQPKQPKEQQQSLNSGQYSQVLRTRLKRKEATIASISVSPSVDMVADTSVGASGFVGELGQYEELLVLQHGLQGQTGDFNYLIKSIGEANALAGSKVALHVSDVNTNRTHDGIDEGGRRLAEDIQRIIRMHGKSLKRISLVGFSLGGMYVRYAIALLLDEESGLIAGLVPNKIVLLASPNLGSRKFGFVRYVPLQGHGLAHVLFGNTGKQLVLLDEKKLLVEMTTDTNRAKLPFVKALKAFRERLIYGNTRGDMMVPYGTATLNPSNCSTDLYPRHLPYGAEEIDSYHDDQGGRVWFTYSYSENSPNSHKSIPGRDTYSEEDVMASRLRSIGWKVTCVDFEMPLWLPLAHNRVVAMSRNMLHTWMNTAGRRSVHHLVDNLIQNSEYPKFDRLVALS